MKAKYINPFIESVVEFFSTMLMTQVRRGDPTVWKAEGESGQVVALIGLSGPVRGTVALALPADTAMKLTGQLLGEEVTELNDLAFDSVSEACNIVAGGAKARLPVNGGVPVNLGLPTVISGDRFKVSYPSDSVWVNVPFDSDLGSFSLRITMKSTAETEGE